MLAAFSAMLCALLRKLKGKGCIVDPEIADRIRQSPYPVILGHRSLPGLVGFLLHPVRIPIQRKRTWRRLLSSKLVASRILWRGHANQGRNQPGRRAFLEENK